MKRLIAAVALLPIVMFASAGVATAASNPAGTGQPLSILPPLPPPTVVGPAPGQLR